MKQKMKEKIKILNSELDILRNESLAKDKHCPLEQICKFGRLLSAP